MNLNTNKRIFRHQTKVLGRGIPTLAIALILLVGAGSAALLSQYGTVSGQTTSQQSVVFLDGSDTAIFSWDQSLLGHGIMAGDTYFDTYTVKNRAEVDAPIYLEDMYSRNQNAFTNEEPGIMTRYYKYGVLDETYSTSGDVPADISIEDTGTTLLWTIDIDENAIPNDKDLWSNYALAISADGTTPDFQVHSNSGTTGAFPDGEHLRQNYVGGWGTPHTAVTTLSEINATGERNTVDNTDMIYTVEISKSELDMEGFSWALNVQTGEANNINSKYPTGFSWTDATTWNELTFGDLTDEFSEFDDFTVLAGETMTFGIENEFNVALQPADYEANVMVRPGPFNNQVNPQ